MVFTSVLYFCFLVVALVLYYILPLKFRNYFLIAASIVFYLYTDVKFVFLILSVIIVNFLLGIQIEKENNKKKQRLLWKIGLFINIGTLIFFKYINFLIANVLALLDLTSLKSEGPFPVLEIILPLGLSFYIFQTIGYVTDVYRGTQKAEKDLSHFSLFILFFPKLLVGPIERAQNFLPQLRKKVSFDTENLVEGCRRIAWGLFKKLVVADRISIYQNFVISSAHHQSGSTLLFASILYTFQVYADFSGYTDIALGTARLFGFNLMENFKHPLFAKNLSDFWRRWHISLSSWVNDYIFNPIALKRRQWGNWGILYALLISFIVIGIWHGASWNYVLFGILQAFALFYEILTRKARKKIAKKMPGVIYKNLSILFTFMYVSFCLIIFRTPTFSDSLTIINGILYNTGNLFFDKIATLLFILVGCGIMLAHDYLEENKNSRIALLLNKNWKVQNVSYVLLIIYIMLTGVFDGGQFIYFAF